MENRNELISKLIESYIDESERISGQIDETESLMRNHRNLPISEFIKYTSNLSAVFSVLDSRKELLGTVINDLLTIQIKLRNES